MAELKIKLTALRIFLGLFLATYFSLALSFFGPPTHRLKSGEGVDLPVRVTAYPVDENKVAPTVLIAHGSDGVSGYHTEWARRIRSWGYNAIIIDHYTLRGITIHTGRVIEGARGEDRARDMVHAAHWILQQPWHQGKLAAIGISQGGAGVLALSAKQEELDYYKITRKGEKVPYSAVIALYPGCSIFAPPIKPTIAVQMHLASDDTLANPAFCSPLDDSLYEVNTYQGATHSFDMYLSPHIRLPFVHRYDPKIAIEFQERAKVFLDKHLK